MDMITIPKQLVKDDLVVLPRKVYEALLGLKKAKEFTPSAAHKKALVKAENNLKRGRSLSYNEFVRKLGFKN